MRASQPIDLVIFPPTPAGVGRASRAALIGWRARAEIGEQPGPPRASSLQLVLGDSEDARLRTPPFRSCLCSLYIRASAGKNEPMICATHSILSDVLHPGNWQSTCRPSTQCWRELPCNLRSGSQALTALILWIF